MKKDFKINGISFQETITRLEMMMDNLHDEDFCTVVSARDFMEWLQEESESNSYNEAKLKVGDCRYIVSVTGCDRKYEVRKAILKKISKTNSGRTNYTFKFNYTTVTFVDSSIGKKVFVNEEDAIKTANSLNQKEK